MSKGKTGLLNLAKKSFAVITAAFSTLSQVKADIPASHHSIDENKDLNFSESYRNVLKPKLILKLNIANPENSLVLMHRSHSSHSSHRSHSSHYSSSYGSQRTYAPTPSSTYTPSSSAISSPKKNPSNKTTTIQPLYTKPGNNSPLNTGADQKSASSLDSNNMILGERILKKGCEGKDVEELQRLLVKVKKDIIITGYFGNQTESIVMRFQEMNELKPDGIVNAQTLTAIKNKKK